MFKKIFLNAGDFYWGSGDVKIHTVLGSCVSITVYHPKKKIGGICHYLLPDRDKNKIGNDGRSADGVIELFRTKIISSGLPIEEFEVKVFGGASFMPGSSDECQVGIKNVNKAVAFLKEKNIIPKIVKTGGKYSRVLYFDLSNGDVWLKETEI